MSDRATRAIDNAFDAFDKLVDGADRVLNRSRNTEQRMESRAPSSSTKIATRRARIEEVVDAETGTTSYLVTAGPHRAECSTRATAEIVRAALEIA